MSAGKKSPPDDGDEELVDPEAEGEEDEGELHGGAVELPHQYRHQLVHKSLHLNWLLFRIVTFSVKKNTKNWYTIDALGAIFTILDTTIVFNTIAILLAP